MTLFLVPGNDSHKYGQIEHLYNGSDHMTKVLGREAGNTGEDRADCRRFVKYYSMPQSVTKCYNNKLGLFCVQGQVILAIC